VEEPAPKKSKDMAPKGWELSNCGTLANSEKTETSILAVSDAFVVHGSKCNHGENLPYSGRVHLAHSLAELDTNVATYDRIIVAQTLGNETTREEVLKHVSAKRIMTVVRAEQQCIYCAYRTAHATRALVIVG
jgi:hypothetical protein